jgi:Astacin (Peptidase family M12A)
MAVSRRRKASGTTRRSSGRRREAAAAVAPLGGRRFCGLREGPPRQFSPDVGGERVRLIVMHGRKWVNGTPLKYAFFENQAPFRQWTGNDALRAQVRKAFARWTALGIGLRFEEVADRSAAEIRIGFEADDGHWSYVGRDVLNQGSDDRTMNLDPNDGIQNGEYGIDVACHEIGHTLGFPHEHQNPNAGIVWDEEAVYRALSLPPNSWPREKTFHNIIRKIPPDQVQGSSWDPNSVMHYPFEAGLILQPEQYRAGLQPAGGLSARDKEWVRTFYPPLRPADHADLQLLQAQRLSISPGQQRNFLLKPDVTRNYEIRTFGASDTVMVLFLREANGRDAYLTADDDSGESRNAYLRRRLLRGRVYVLRVRLYYASASGETSVMWW